MNVLAIMGSRNPAGQTARAIAALLEGLEKARGAKTESVYLPTLTLERCRQCRDNGWGDCREKGSCVIQDDFSGLVGKVARADLLVFATPVYFGDLSESMRAFLDRLRRICRHESGKHGVEGKPVLGVCVAGGGGGGAPECCASLNKVLGTCGFAVLDVTPVRRQNLEVKLPILRAMGESYTF